MGAQKYVLGSFGQIGVQNLLWKDGLNQPQTMV